MKNGYKKAIMDKKLSENSKFLSTKFPNAVRRVITRLTRQSIDFSSQPQSTPKIHYLVLALAVCRSQTTASQSLFRNLEQRSDINNATVYKRGTFWTQEFWDKIGSFYNREFQSGFLKLPLSLTIPIDRQYF